MSSDGGIPNCSVVGLISFAPSLVLFLVPWGYLLTRVPAKRGIAWRERALFHSTSSPTGIFIEVVSAVMSCMSCILYIASSYMSENPIWAQAVEVIFCTNFMVYWGFNFWLAQRRIAYIVSLQSLLDLGTSLPTLISVFTGLCGDTGVSAFLAIARVLKFLRVFRLLRVVRSLELLTDTSEDAIHRQGMRLISTVVVIMVVSTGFVQFLANDLDENWSGVLRQCLFDSMDGCTLTCPNPRTCADPVLDTDLKDGKLYYPCDMFTKYRGKDAKCKNKMKFHDSLYYTIATFGTVGYGDVAPIDALSRISMIFLITVAIYAVPMQVNKLNQLRELRSEYDGVFRKAAGRPHCILSCNPGMELGKFISEFFHEDHKESYAATPQLVLMCDCQPDADLRKLLLHYASKQRLVFIRGDASSPEDLGRARCDMAAAVFVLTDSRADDQNKEDELAVMRVMMVRRVNPFVRVYTMLLQPENERHIINAGIRRSSIMCQNQMRLSMLGFAVSCPGLPALLNNLVQSISWRQSFGISQWQEEYCRGMVMEMYPLKPRRDMIGSKFGSLVLSIKKQTGGILFAIAKNKVEAIERTNSADSQRSANRLKQSMKRAASSKKMQSGRNVFAEKQKKADANKKAWSQSFKKIKIFDRSATHEDGVNDDNCFPCEFDEERMVGVQFNPGPDYAIQEGDTLFVLAEDSSSLQEFQTVQKESDDWLSQLFPSIAISRERNREAQKLHSLLPQGDPRSGQSSPPNNKGTGRTANESVKKIGTASKIARSWSREIVAANAVAPEPEPAGDKALLLTSLRERPANADATDWGKFEQLVRTRNTQLETSKKRVYQSLDRMLHAVGDAYGVAQQVIIERHMRRYIDHQIIAASSRTHARNNQKSPVPLRSLDEVVVRHVPANIAGHIVVVGSTMDDMQYLLAALHMRNLEEQKRVTVFVLDEFPTKREWEEAGQYPNVYVMINAREGGGYLRELLARAGTKRANSIIFSTDIAQMRTNQGAADSYVLAGLLDGLYVTINEPHVRVMSELSQGGCNRKMARRLMAGRSAETMNVEQRIQSFSLMEGLGHLDGDYISGHSVSTDLLYLLICQLYYNPYILAIFQQILLGHQLNRELDVDDDNDGPRDSVILYKPVAAEYVGRTFGELFEGMLESEGSIVIGMYRRAASRDSLGERQRYVYTNPRLDAVIRTSDNLYVIPSLPLHESPSTARGPEPVRVPERTASVPKPSPPEAKTDILKAEKATTRTVSREVMGPPSMGDEVRDDDGGISAPIPFLQASFRGDLPDWEGIDDSAEVGNKGGVEEDVLDMADEVMR